MLPQTSHFDIDYQEKNVKNKYTVHRTNFLYLCPLQFKLFFLFKI